jgi:hypothetical protein
MAIVGQVVQQTAKLDKKLAAGVIAYRRILLAQKTEPPSQMGSATQLREFVQLGKGRVEIHKKFASTVAIVCHRVRPESCGQDLDVALKYLIETRS